MCKLPAAIVTGYIWRKSDMITRSRENQRNSKKLIAVVKMRLDEMYCWLVSHEFALSLSLSFTVRGWGERVTAPIDFRKDHMSLLLVGLINLSLPWKCVSFSRTNGHLCWETRNTSALQKPPKLTWILQEALCNFRQSVYSCSKTKHILTWYRHTNGLQQNVNVTVLVNNVAQQGCC